MGCDTVMDERKIMLSYGNKIAVSCVGILFCHQPFGNILNIRDTSRITWALIHALVVHFGMVGEILKASNGFWDC